MNALVLVRAHAYDEQVKTAYERGPAPIAR